MSLPTTPYKSTGFNEAEITRFIKVTMDIIRYYNKGIQEQMMNTAEDMKEDLEQTAPYDTQEIDDYHMTEHMTNHPYAGRWGKGREIESEAAYSGHLEYGTAYHGIQYVFFRPATEKAWIAHKKACIKAMTEILKT